jgi:hypothetical protein
MARKSVVPVTSELDPLGEVEQLVATREAKSAVRLAELTGSSDKAVAKAARRGLYLLKQAGIEIPKSDSPTTTTAAATPAPANKAYLTSPDGNGSQMLLFVQDDQWGGSPWLITFLVSYGSGLKDLGASKLSRKEIAESLDELRSRPGRLLVEADVDYARWLLQQAVEINRRESISIPQGYSDDLKRVGLPQRTFDAPLIYDLIDIGQVREDATIDRDPEKLFGIEIFKTWLINLRVMDPWVEKYMAAFDTKLALDESQLKQRGDAVIDEAADTVLADEGAPIYRRLLEEAALVLFMSGDQGAARQALYHATSLENVERPHSNPFLRALTERTIYLIIALIVEEEEEARGSGNMGLVEQPEPGGIIERV